MTSSSSHINELQVENKRLKAEIKMLTGWVSLVTHNNTEIFESLRWLIDAYNNKIISKEEFYSFLPQIRKDLTKHLQTSKDTNAWLHTQLGGFTPQQNVLIALELFNKLKKEYMKALDRKQLTFKFKGDPAHEIISDKILLFYILSKIFHNAIKYSNKGQEIHMEIAQNKNKQVLSIIDFGIGISEENINSIYSFDTPVFEGTSGEVGAGLSLKIVQNFVYLLKGNIEIKSLLNKGTAVSVFLPLIE